MIVTTVLIKVKPDQVQNFISATIRNHDASIQEKGNRRFDVLQSQEDSTIFMLYEAYDSKEAAATHKETAHYAEWKEKVADWMAEPRKGTPYNALRPL